VIPNRRIGDNDAVECFLVEVLVKQWGADEPRSNRANPIPRAEYSIAAVSVSPTTPCFDGARSVPRSSHSPWRWPGRWRSIPSSGWSY